MGRPKLPKGQAKGGMLRVRFTLDELRAIQAAAKGQKKTVSDWIRDVIGAAKR
ncbi:MAG: hypothetical protein WBE86_12935 [Candidatus Acidiferrales bacterium]